MLVPQVLLLILYTCISSIRCEVGPYRPISDTSRICLATYVRHLDNEKLLGTWYYVYHIATWSSLPPSEECREFVITRPTQEDMDRYKIAYNLTGMPYTFKEDAILYTDTRFAMYSGLLLGNREAKFFLENPRKRYVRPESYDVVLIRYINDNYILYEHCSMRGNSKWLMSKIKQASDEELNRIIDSQNDLRLMENQKFCAKAQSPYDDHVYE